MAIQTLHALMASISSSHDSATPLNKTFVHTYLTALIAASCDRVPIKVRNLDEPFYLAGVDAENVYLSHAANCLVSQFSYDELEPLYLGTVEDMSELVTRWLNTEEFEASQEMAEAASTMELAGKVIPVTLRWPANTDRADRGKSRKGALTNKSTIYGSPSTAWVIGVETHDTSGVTHRYGLTRLGRALHDGKELTMALKPGVPF